MDSDNRPVLALYDFASKQEYIYKTSKIKEISGASALLAGLYETFIDTLNENGIKTAYKENGEYLPFREDDFLISDCDGQVLYDGGGNLMVLYKSKDRYIQANRLLSVMLLKNYPGITMLSSYTEKTNNFSDGNASDVTKLYAQNHLDKNRFPAYDLTGVTPFTQLDPMTFLPVTHKFGKNGNEGNPYPHSEVSLSEDRFVKASSYIADKDDELYEDGLTAVIYIDGNSMGKKLMSLAAESYEDGVKNLRFFSENVQEKYVTAPIKAIKEKGIKFRKVIGGGDEITLICRAQDSLNAVKAYFDCLKDSGCVIPEECKENYYPADADTAAKKEAALKNTSCAGIAVIHAHTPFTVAYELAEAACENAKKKAHKVPGNYFDFYYCHAGPASDFDTLRETEQSMTARPYAYSGTVSPDAAKWEDFERLVPVVQLAGRANAKALGTAAQKGEVSFRFETERVNAYLASKKTAARLSADDMKIIYDISEFYDIWFRKKEEGGTKDEA